MKTTLALFLVIFSFLGVLDASYISYEKLSGTIPPCTVQFRCGDVLNSPWASIGPLPLATVGLLFYSLFLIISILFYFGKKEVRILIFRFPTEKLLAVQGAFGAGFSLYLLFIMGVVLKAWCLYCLLSAGTCIALFIVSLINYFLLRNKITKAS